MFRPFLVLILGLFLTCFSLQAQSAALNVTALFPEILSNNPVDSDEDWSFYQDADNQLFLIDFESLSYNIFELVLRDSNTNRIVYREDVFDLPVNSIYEFDYSGYAQGSYTVELRSTVRTLEQEVDFH